MARRDTVDTEFYLSDSRSSAHIDLATDAGGARRTTAQKRALLREHNVDARVLAVLDTRFDIGFTSYTVLDAAGTACDGANGQPGFVVASALQAALRHWRLDVAQERTLFGILGWQFECHACGGRQGACAFEGTGYVLWGDVEPPQVRLRGGPCVECQRAARASNDPGAGLVPYKVVAP